MTGLGLYLPGDSPLHRLPAGAKLLGLLLVGAGSFLLRDRPAAVAVGLLGVAGLYALARVPPRLAVAQIRPLLWVLVVTAGFHVLVNGWLRAAVVVGVIALLVMLAALVTLTTRTSDLVDAVVAAAGPLRRLGVDPERLGLVMALGIRCVPVVVGLAGQVREAQLARGLGTSPRAFAVPLIVRSLRHADTLGEALVARGADD
jgi:biotin transport system permease protein